MTRADSHYSRLEPVVALVDQAGAAIMEIYARLDRGIQSKADNSPLTAADLAANAIICNGLASHWPEIPILTEEADNPFTSGEEPPLYWAVDPLDGTREFIKRNGEFTVNVALIENGDPVFGVVSAPALGLLHAGAIGHGARMRNAAGWRPIAVAAKRNATEPVRVASSRSHPSPQLAGWLQRFANVEQRQMGSSLKFCLVAQGDVDVYPRFGPTSYWDTSAGHAVLAAAGGRVSLMDGTALTYRWPAVPLNPDFVAWGMAG